MSEITEVVDNAIIGPLEDAFDAIGAMQGEFAPVKRAAIGAGAGYILSYGIKPTIAFTADGKERPFALGSTDPNRTWLPAWAIVTIPALAFSVLI